LHLLLNLAALAPVLANTLAPACARLTDAIDAGAAYLADAVLPSGEMRYRQYPDGRDLTPKYNLLRHGGALFALGSVAATDPAARIAHSAAVLRAGRWLLDCCVRPVPGFDAIAAPWWPPVRGDSRCLEAKLGGAALALIALLEANRLTPGAIPAIELERLARFLVYMQRADGSFFSKYRHCEGGRDSSWTSLYYPGEAALALTLYARADPDPLWRGAAISALDYLARQRAGRRAIPADHWAMIATAAVFDTAVPSDPQQRSRLLHHVSQVTQAILEAPRVAERGHSAHGSFGQGGRTTPTATRLEALIAARHVLSLHAPEEANEARLLAVLTDGVEFLLRAQRRSAPARGAVPRAVLTSTRRAEELRIDYTQHALSVFLGYRDEVLHCPQKTN